jgi:hypothetical protein
LKVRDQDFDAAIGNQFANLADGFGEHLGAADIVVVPIHAGDDSMFQAERGNGLSYAARFVPVDGLWTAFGDSAESAAACADITEQHEGCGLVVPALADVRALRRFADGVQA